MPHVQNEALQALKAKHTATIATIQQRIDWTREGKLELYSVDANGRKTSMTESSIERDLATIRMLQKIVDAVDGSEGSGEKFMDLLIS